jgi:ribose 5-phosphate isomerase B
VKIAIGADHRGTGVRGHLIEFLRQHRFEIVDLPTSCLDEKACDYPDDAFRIGTAVAQGQVDLGILVCGSGIGMSIAANKVRGVRAALIHDEIGADLSRRHNDANVLCLPADMLGIRFIDKIVLTWLRTPFEGGGRHARRVAKVAAIERGDDPLSVDENTGSVSRDGQAAQAE